MNNKKNKEPKKSQEELFRETAKSQDCDEKINLKEVLKKIAKPKK